MQKCFLVSNKSTQVRDYLEHRSIVEVVEEHSALNELDLQHLGIIDVDKFIYIYYQLDDGDITFRSELNILRQLLGSAFFRVDEAIFILVGCSNPMLEDLIHSACRDSNLVGSKLEIIHHSGTLHLTDVSRYVAGAAYGSEITSSYKSVYISESDSDERERYTHAVDGLDTMLPALTDQYSMYRKRAEVEAISSGHSVVETLIRPEVLRDFSYRPNPVVNRWNAFLFSGDLYTKFERGIDYLCDYYTRLGIRAVVVDLTSSNSVKFNTESWHVYSLQDIAVKTSYTEWVAYIKCRYNQLGYLVEMLDNIDGVSVYMFLCDRSDYGDLCSFLRPVTQLLYCNFVTHFTEAGLQDYLASGYQSTTLFLSRASVFEQFDVLKYKDQFTQTRVAAFNTERVDTVDFYNCAIGGRYDE